MAAGTRHDVTTTRTVCDEVSVGAHDRVLPSAATGGDAGDREFGYDGADGPGLGDGGGEPAPFTLRRTRRADGGVLCQRLLSSQATTAATSGGSGAALRTSRANLCRTPRRAARTRRR